MQSKLFYNLLSWCLLTSFIYALTPDALMYDILAKPGLVAASSQNPTFSWNFKDGVSGDFQTAFHIQVATSSTAFRRDKPDLWDSGKVLSRQSLYNTYQGSALPNDQEIYWRVRVWDRSERLGPWSQTYSFKTKKDAPPTPRYPLTQTTRKPQSIITNHLGHILVDFGRTVFGWPEFVPPHDIEGGAYTIAIGDVVSNNTLVATVTAPHTYLKTRGALTSPIPYRIPLPESPVLAGTLAWPAACRSVHPFRYLEILQTPIPIERDTVRQIALHYPFDLARARFVSSNNELDRIFKLCKHSIWATTFAGIYLANTHQRQTTEMAAYINQLSHYCLDNDFTLARFTHEFLLENPTWPTEAKQHSVSMAWADWMYSGNLESLRRNFERLKLNKTLEQLARKSDGLLESGHAEQLDVLYGRDFIDWPDSERDGFEFQPVNAVVNAFYALNLRQMAAMARALGETSEAEAYLARYQKLLPCFHQTFYDSERGCYIDGVGATHASLHANMLPLAFDLVPADERQRVAHFVNARALACSPYGAQYLLEALFQAGWEQAAIHLLTRNEQRSWHQMLNQDSTLTLGAWDIYLSPELNSYSAIASAPANIIPRYILGVRPLEAGFGHFLIKPQIGDLEAVEGYLPSVRGTIRVGVRQSSQHYQVSVWVPFNTTARVELPNFKGGSYTLDGTKIKPKLENERHVTLVPAGSHTLVWTAR